MGSQTIHSKSRADLRRQAKRRRVISLIVLLLLAVSAPVWSEWIMDRFAEQTFYRWSDSRLKSVRYDGLSYLNSDSIAAAAQFPYDSSLFEINFTLLHDKIQRLPWVAEVELRRRLPDCLEVVVKEHSPVATIRSSQVYALSASGIILPVPPASWVWDLPMITPPRSLALTAGDTLSNEAMLTLLHQIVIIREVSPGLWSNLSELYYHENEIHATLLSPPVILKMNRTNEQRTWAALENLIAGELRTRGSLKTVTIIDLRIPGNIIVSSPAPKQPRRESSDA